MCGLGRRGIVIETGIEGRVHPSLRPEPVPPFPILFKARTSGSWTGVVEIKAVGQCVGLVSVARLLAILSIGIR